jgi:hypothetical protein
MILVYTIVLLTIILLLVLFVLKADKKEGFYFEVTPGKDRWCCDRGGFQGKPVSFEYSSDAERFNCDQTKQKQTYPFGQHGLLGQNVLGIEHSSLGIPKTVRRCDEPLNLSWN